MSEFPARSKTIFLAKAAIKDTVLKVDNRMFGFKFSKFTSIPKCKQVYKSWLDTTLLLNKLSCLSTEMMKLQER